jgi:hypothetical protein
MREAVGALVETKFGADGTYRRGVRQSSWLQADSYAAKIPAPSVSAVDATIAYCEYIYDWYGRFPAYTAPFRTIIGFQVCRVDVDFYDRFYQPDAVSRSVRECTKRSLRNETEAVNIRG